MAEYFLRMTASNWSCLKGLVIQPVAPAALACRFRPWSDSVVRKTMGTPAVGRQPAERADEIDARPFPAC